MTDIDTPDLLAAPFAVGATADLYLAADGNALKLFHADRPPTLAAHEARIARAVCVAVPADAPFCVPTVGPFVTANERPGLLYERINGPSLLTVLMESLDQPDALRAFSHHLATLHFNIHTLSVHELASALPDQRAALTNALDRAPSLPPAVQQHLADLREDAPRLCHGDFHPGNVLLPPNARPVVIDWCDATWGNPLADVARTLLLLGVGTVPDTPAMTALAANRAAFCQAYRQHYVYLSGAPDTLIDRWLPVVAAARLAEDIPATERDRLLALLQTAFPAANVEDRT